MIKIDSNYNIEITRGDMLPLTIKAKNKKDGSYYIFQTGDVIRIKIMERNNCNSIIFQKDFSVETPGEKIDIKLTSEETKFGEIISRPVEYWYEIELNPDTLNTQTIIGYTKDDKAKLFTLTPEGGDK